MTPSPSDEPAWATPRPQRPVRRYPAQGAPFADGGWADALSRPTRCWPRWLICVQRDGLGKLDDDQLTGVLQAANRLAAWSASPEAGRRVRARRPPRAVGPGVGDWRPFDHVDDEVAVALTLTRRSAARLLDLALSLDRLPLTRAALAAGLIDERRAEVIAEELAGLDDEHAAAVEKLIIGRAPELTSGQLRALVRRAVLSADPKAARRRKEKALKDARVEMFPETSGTAALSGRDLPPAAALAADKHLTALAQALKAAGIPGTLDTLRARAYLHLLSGQPAATLILQTASPGRPGREPSRRPPTAPRPASARRRHPAARPGAAPGNPAPGGAPVPSRSRRRPAWAARHGQPDHAPVGLARLDPVPRRRPRLRPHRRRRLPHPRRPARPRPRQPVVRHPHRPRRAPRRPRLRPPRPPRPTPAASHPRTSTPAPPPSPPGPTPDPGHPRRPRPHPGPGLATRPDLRHPANQQLHPPTPITRLPAQPRAAPPHPGPQPHLYRPRLPPPRHPLRPGPRHPL